jgi:hydroxymethylbilane synthase
MVSAVGQGAIGIEIREDDEFMLHVMERIGHPETMECVTAERVVMRMLEGGCQVPIGAYCRYEDGTLTMDAMVGSVDGTHIIRQQLCGDAGEPEALGDAMVERLLQLGAAAILDEIRGANGADELLAT